MIYYIIFMVVWKKKKKKFDLLCGSEYLYTTRVQRKKNFVPFVLSFMHTTLYQIWLERCYGVG